MNTSLTPYILFGLGQLVAFVVWIVNLQNKITKMETKIEQLEERIKAIKHDFQESESERKKDHNWFREQLNKANEALAVAKSVMEGLVLKEMKTRKA
jgi:predicted  nucleic acid-binding Zn-ribbon protein